jgi:hypothetical protein
MKEEINPTKENTLYLPIKQECIYLNPADDGLELYQVIGRIRPADKYFKDMA